MLNPNLKKIIDEKWDNCWPVSNLKPIAILDLTSYIYFLKKSDDEDLITKNLPSLKSGHFIFTKEVEEFTWTMLRDMDAHAIHDLFTRQFGILDLMSEYGQSGFLYSRFFSTSLLLKPTSKLLFNVIEIINLIESCDTATQPVIIEYLFSKAQNAQKEAQFIPQFISRLMVSISEPGADDIVCDISSGIGSLLINAAEYIKDRNPSFKYDLSSKLKGIESNASLLRMTAMRMMLHGMKEPDVQILNSSDVNFSIKPTLFISSLLPKGNEDETITEDKIPQPGNVQMEINLLNNILKNLQAGSRAVVLVQENLLKNILPEIQDIRREIVENTRLEGVIHLSSHSRSFSAAGILIFSKHPSETTSQVWFCKMGKPEKRRTLNETIANPNQNDILLSEELSQVNVVLDQWKNRKDASNRNCFFINAYDIKTNNYNLNFNDYKLVSSEEPVANTDGNTDHPEADGSPVVAIKKESLRHFYKGPAPLEKRRHKRKAAPAILLIIVLIITAGWSYLYFVKDNKELYSHSAAVQDSVKTISKKPDATSDSKAERNKIKKNTTGKEMLPSAHKSENTTAHDAAKRYTVVNKAWFHSAPDSSKRKTFYLQPRQDLVVVPTQEENGFVYVVYINKKGQSTHGWLAKKDLEPVD